MTDENEKHTVAKNMRMHGGSFVMALGHALERADMVNTYKIKRAFPEYWERYLNWDK